VLSGRTVNAERVSLSPGAATAPETPDADGCDPVLGGWHFDGSGARRRLGHRIAEIAQALDVDDDRLPNEAVDLLTRFADYP
jgi:hypothetical protein